MPELDEQTKRQALADMIANANQPVTLVMERKLLWTLISQLQLALRHPGNCGASAWVTDAWIRMIIDSVASTTPAIRAGLMAGFDSAADRPN